MEFYMVRHYWYSGYSADMDDVMPCSTSQKGMDYLRTVVENFEGYSMETGPDGFYIAIRREGAYAYDHYYLEKMEMDVEL
jgi:hypothetical protein